jgi:threonine/homoserine/homoserine lactone efflux protein
MPTSELLALLLFATAMAFTPGPNTLLAAALGANGGLRAASRFVLGVPFGWGLLLLGCALGLGTLVQAAPALRGAIKWGGLAYMLWLAWKLAQSASFGSARDGALDIGFGKGVMLQFVNIKAWMNALVISASWVAVADPMWPRLAVVLPLMMAYGLASNLTYALAGSMLRRWLSQGRRLVMFNRVLATVLVATVAWMATF